MFTSFIVALNAVLPFVLYMSIGATVVKVGLVDRPFLRKLNGFCFKAFFPFMTFMNIYDMEGDIGLSGRFLMYACGSMAVIFILSILAVLHFEKDDKKRPCLMQAFYRSNILLFAIPLARTLLGDNAVGLATALVLIFVPFYNVSSVILLETFCGSGRSKPSKLIKEILTNPLIVGLLLGVIFKQLGIILPNQVMKVIRSYGEMSTPLALTVLGGILQFSSAKSHVKYMIAVIVGKLILIPAALLFVGVALNFTGLEIFSIFLVYATPVATAAFTMCQAMGADGDLMGEIVASSTVTAVVTLFFWIVFMQNIGII